MAPNIIATQDLNGVDMKGSLDFERPLEWIESQASLQESPFSHNHGAQARIRAGRSIYVRLGL